MTYKDLTSFPVWLLILLIGFPQLSETIYTPSLPDVASSLGVHADLAELTLSIYFVGFAVGVAIWGWVADRWGRHPAIQAGIAIYVGACMGCLFSASIESLLFFRFLQALGASAGSVVTMTMMRDIFQGKKLNQLFALTSMALSIAPAIGPFLGGMIDQYLGWQANFSLLGMLGCFLLLCNVLMLSETKPHDAVPASWKTIKQVASQMASDPMIWKSAWFIAVTNGILFGFYAEAPFIFIELLKLTPSQYGYVGLMIAGCMLAAGALSHRLLEKWLPQQIILVGSATCFGGALLMSSLLLSGHMGFVSVLIPMAIVFVGIGLIIPNTLSLALCNYTLVRGTAGSLFGLLYYIGIAGLLAGMSFLHNGSALPMPLYFLGLSGTLLISLPLPLPLPVPNPIKAKG